MGGGRTGSATRGAPARAAVGAPCLRESGSPASVSLREGVTHSPLVPSRGFPRLLKVEAEGKSEAAGAPGQCPRGGGGAGRCWALPARWEDARTGTAGSLFFYFS